MFTDGQSALMMANLTSLFGLRNMEDEYGILPLAKYTMPSSSIMQANTVSDFYYLPTAHRRAAPTRILRLPHSRS